MKSLLKTALLLYCFTVNAQVETINLPTGNETLRTKSLAPIFSIYVDKNNTVYFEKEPVNAYELGKLLTYNIYKLPIDQGPYLQIHLYIDENVKYNVVDKIKTEIASTYQRNIIYKTNSIEDKDVLKGVYWRNHHSFYKINFIEKQLTIAQKEKNKRYNDSLIKVNEQLGIPNYPPPPAPPSFWQTEFYFKLYSDQQDVIDEVLNEKKSNCLVINNEGLNINSKNIAITNFEAIEELFLTNDILLVYFDKNLKYINYLNTIRLFATIEKKHHGRKKAFPFEISTELENIHKKASIILCD